MTLTDTLTTAFTPEPSPDYSPIQLSCTDTADRPLLPLLVITACNGTNTGFSNRFWLNQYVFQLEQELRDKGIAVTQYPWNPTSYTQITGTAPYSSRLHHGLILLRTAGDTNPILHYDDSTDAYFPTGYTDLYITHYASHMPTPLNTVETALHHVLNKYKQLTAVTYHNTLAAQNSAYV